MGYKQDIHDKATNMGFDPDTLLNSTGDDLQVPSDFDFQKTVVIQYEPVSPSSAEVGDYEVVEDHGDAHLKTVVKKRPQCPTCNYILVGEDDPLALPGECWDCKEPICPKCGVDCAACENTMCPNHSHGHGVENDAYCSDCLEDREEKLRFQRTMKLRGQRHQEDKERREHRREQETKRRKLALKERKHLFDEQYEKKQLKLNYWNALMNHKENLLKAVSNQETDPQSQEDGEGRAVHDARSAFRTEEANKRRQLRRARR